MTWFVTFMTIMSLINVNPNGNLYAKTMVVTAVETETDTVYLKDFNSFSYKANGLEDFEIGDYASCIMYDNATEIVADDVVLSAKYENFETMYEIEYIPIYIYPDELTSETTDELIS